MKSIENKFPENMPVAIIGMGCFFPKSSGLKEYWRLLIRGEDGITDIPATHWSPDDYFNEDPNKPDHVYCKRGGFISPVSFDPIEFGIPPNSLEATDTSQLLGLVAAKMALEDSGYGNGRPFNRERTSVILGATGTQELAISLGARLGHPNWRRALKDAGVPDEKAEDVIKKISDSYVPWQENSFPGLLGNVIAGRICNRLDLSGTNCVVDAACASSISAIHLASLELLSGRSDMVVTGGVDTLNDIFMHMCFSKTYVLSPTGDARPFSKDADGTVLGEGIGMLVLKRLEDAEKDSDRIYAVIKALGSSSDGKSQSIYAPRPEGQEKALRMAYTNAGINPATLELIEAHGTGTRVGDRVELQALTRVFNESNHSGNGRGRWCAIGSVKSMIGHTKAAAGAAGIIKAALSLYHKVVPPTLKADKPDPDLHIDDTPFYLNTMTRPWFSNKEHPRRSGVSAFGFGGSNFHVVLEEYQPHKQEISWSGSVEIVALSAATQKELISRIRSLVNTIDSGLSSRDFSLQAAKTRRNFSSKDLHRILFVLEHPFSGQDIGRDISRLFISALDTLETGNPVSFWNIRNAYYGGPETSDTTEPGKIAFIFPGQGSQYVGMGRELVCSFPEAFDVLENPSDAYEYPHRLGDYIYPNPAKTAKEKTDQERALQNTQIAQPAIGAVSLAMHRVLQGFGITPDATCGHSFGELTALCAANRIDTDTFFSLAIARGRFMAEASRSESQHGGGMLAVNAPLESLADLISDAKLDVILANRNSPNQGVLSGSKAEIVRAEIECKKHGFQTTPLPVSAAFHSKLVKGAHQPFKQILKTVHIAASSVPVYSNTTGNPYPTDPDQAKQLFGEQIICPVDFVSEIENLFKLGVRTFLEVGPKPILTGLVRSILKQRPVHTLALDSSSGKRSGIADLARTLCHLAAIGHRVDLIHWEKPAQEPKKQMSIPVSGANSRPKAKPKQKIDGCQKKLKNMNRNTKNQKDFITNAFHMTREGLKSIQELQKQTAEAHKKFLETQTAAGRVLQEMMENTRRLTEASLGINLEQPEKPTKTATLQNIPPAPVVPAFEENVPAERPDATPRREAGLPSNPARDKIETTLLNVVSRLTGYPEEMIDLDMDIEADLGIDSIKRVEILSTLEEALPDMSAISPEILGTLKTLGQVIEFLTGAKNGEEPERPVIPEGPKGSEEKDGTENKPAIHPDMVASGSQKTEIETTLLKVVSRLTGYPEDMIGLDMDIEADLGIDSIKRVEILSTLEETLGGLPPISPEIMGTMKTLGQIIEFLAGTVNIDTSQQKQEAAASQLPESVLERPRIISDIISEITPDDKLSETLERKIVSIVETPPNQGKTLSIPKDRRVLVTDDKAGLSEAVVDEFLSRRIDAVLVSPDMLHDLLTDTADFPKIAGLVIVPAFEPLDAAGVDQASNHFLKEVFRIAQQTAPQLIDAAKQGGAFFATTTRLDGAFGFKGRNVANPMQGGLAALSKTAAVEWEGVCCHAIDVAPEWKENQDIATAVVSELLTADPSGPVEIGLSKGSRVTLMLELFPYPEGQKIATDLETGDVVVITGGARGITASAACTLARYAKPTLVLLGRSPKPSPEPVWLASIEDEAGIKRAILENEFAASTATPALIEKSFQKHLANREITRTLEKLRQTGSAVLYYSVDVRKADEVKTLLDSVRSVHGPIRGIIHGAGVLEDRLIVDKTPEQFNRVFDTKVKGLGVLLDAAKHDPLKYIVLFSSISARVGNRGQVDYAMANEVLNKMAQQESINRSDCRVISINWGPWDGGMVSDVLKREFKRKNIELIPPDAGAMCMLHEMTGSKNDPVEVIIGADISSGYESRPRIRLVSDPKNFSPQKSEKLSLTVQREIDVDRYPILKAHMLSGKPVVPFALLTEWLGHCALHENPGLFLHGLDDMRILSGIKLDQGKKMIRLFAGRPRKKGELFEVDVEIRDGLKDETQMVHSRATAILTDTLSPPPEFDPAAYPEGLNLKTYSRNMEEVYEKILFHGDRLHGIRDIFSCSSRGMVARISPAPSPAEWMIDPLRSKWIGDPLVLDSAFQMATVWCFEQMGMASLPSYSAAYRQYRNNFPSEGVTAVLEIKGILDYKMLGDFTFLDTEHTVIARLTGCEAIMDASLHKAFKRQ